MTNANFSHSFVPYHRKNLRMIPESDIGLAVVYASTEKFCNPSFNVGMTFLFIYLTIKFLKFSFTSPSPPKKCLKKLAFYVISNVNKLF